MSSRISPHHSQRSNFYRRVNRSDGSSPSQKGQATTSSSKTASAASSNAADRPDLGENLSAEEREMIHEQFPPSPETSMRIYGRDRGGHQIRPASLGHRIDLQG